MPPAGAKLKEKALVIDHDDGEYSERYQVQEEKLVNITAKKKKKKKKKRGRKSSSMDDVVLLKSKTMSESKGSIAPAKMKVLKYSMEMQEEALSSRNVEAAEKAKREKELEKQADNDDDGDDDEKETTPRKHEEREKYFRRCHAMNNEFLAIIRYREAKADATSSSTTTAPPPKKRLLPKNLRSPVCCIMGDTGSETKLLLDCIRGSSSSSTNEDDQEDVHDEAARSSRITQQQIGATHLPLETILERSKPKTTSFELTLPGLLVVDTPWHQFSFSSKLRSSRALGFCDIAVLVVDIMHGLDRQTIESLNLLKMSNVDFIVALINVDKLHGWKSICNAPFGKSFTKQSVDVVDEFNMRLTHIITQFKEQGITTQVFYKRGEVLKTHSIVPTSALTGEGIPDLLLFLVVWTQGTMVERLTYTSEVKCTVLEVKVVEGLGTTIDVILANGVLHEGDEIVVCGMQGLIVTTIRALLTPHPIKELQGTYMHHKEIKGAQGIKITAEGLEHAITGTGLYVVGPYDDLEEIKELAMEDMASDRSRTSNKSGKGVCVQASTLVLKRKKDQIPKGKHRVCKGSNDNVKLKENVKFKENLKLEETVTLKKKVSASENKDPSGPHDKDLVYEDSEPYFFIQWMERIRKQEKLLKKFSVLVPNWHKLSFEENVACYERNRELLREYREQVRAYEGFHVDVNVFHRRGRIITPVDKDDELMNEKVKAAVAFAVEKYNQSEGKDLKLKRVVKANSKIVLGFIFYLTLEANDRCFYEAKVFDEVGGDGHKLLFFRSAKYYPLVSEKKKEEKRSSLQATRSVKFGKDSGV
ncbi:Translation initiation factor 2, gamma subunit [Trema orientale]|uniref:Translation initiation factor 2, gamma subunit n=1 Tax=Trema orientale TaxID=63057 RepID=A0A2P5C494_TREOI|nr:Translation initiation factor 2, gamma subunit [Trema orientale]